MSLEGYRIFRQEALSDTYRRVIREQVGLLMNYCRSPEEDPDMATHEIRKSTKRIRAVYLLFREAIGKETSSLEQEHFRNISGRLSQHRISKVHSDILIRISRNKRLAVDPTVIHKLLLDIHESHVKLTAEIVEKQKLYLQINGLLTAEMERIDIEPVSECNFDMLANGIHKTYSNGRKKLEVLQNQLTAENLHALRKSVKCLWNQIILIRPVWPSFVGTTIYQLDMLAEKLGYDHDLDDLVHYLNQKRITDMSIPVQLTDFIGLKRKQLQKNIMPLAARLYAEKPKAYAGKFVTYYRVFTGERSEKL